MSYRKASISKNLDWVLVILLIFLVFFGLVNIISATSNIELIDWFDWNGKAGKQLLWIGICAVFAFTIVNIESEFFIRTSMIQYILTLLLLIAVLIIGKKVMNPIGY